MAHPLAPPCGAEAGLPCCAAGWALCMGRPLVCAASACQMRLPAHPKCCCAPSLYAESPPPCGPAKPASASSIVGVDNSSCCFRACCGTLAGRPCFPHIDLLLLLPLLLLYARLPAMLSIVLSLARVVRHTCIWTGRRAGKTKTARRPSGHGGPAGTTVQSNDCRATPHHHFLLLLAVLRGARSLCRSGCSLGLWPRLPSRQDRQPASPHGTFPFTMEQQP